MSELDRRGHTRTAYFYLRRKYSNKLTLYGEMKMRIAKAVKARIKNVEPDVPVTPTVEVETPTVTQTPQGAGV